MKARAELSLLPTLGGLEFEGAGGGAGSVGSDQKRGGSTDEVDLVVNSGGGGSVEHVSVFVVGRAVALDNKIAGEPNVGEESIGTETELNIVDDAGNTVAVRTGQRVLADEIFFERDGGGRTYLDAAPIEDVVRGQIAETKGSGGLSIQGSGSDVTLADVLNHALGW